MASSFVAGQAQEVNTTTAGDQSGASVATLSNGGHVVAWNSNGNVVAQFFDASGAKSGGEVVLFTGYSLGDIGALADGSLVCSATRTYQGPDFYPRSQVWFQHLSSGGTALAAPVLVDDTGTYDVAVSAGDVYTMPGGGFGVTDIHTTRPTPLSSVSETVHVYDAAGSSTGASIPTSDNYLQETARLGSGAFLTEGNTSFGPTPVQSAMWRTTDAQGNTIASAELKGTYSTDGYGEGGAVSFADGRALAVWSHIVYGYKGIGTVTWQAQWIDASGHASGGVFDLALASYGDNPHFTALADGSFIATWTQQANYGAPYDLYAQHFTSSANPDTGAVKLASLDPNNSGYDVTATADGGFIVGYQRSGDGLDVWQQEFDVATSPGGTATSSTIYPGIDQMSFPGAHTDYTVSESAQGFVITGPDGTDSLGGIERVRFGDGYAVALDIHGNGGEAYRLYQAAFDRTPDLQGLGFQMNDLDMGYSLAHIAQNFIDSPEFQRTYGPSISDTEFITLLYRNVLDREPEAEGLQYHLDEFAHGDTRANMLTHFSESPENKANVIGAIADGMLYVPYV